MSDPEGIVEHVEAPTREEFERRWVDRNRPVILTGIASRWPAIERWTPEYLRSVAGDNPVNFHYDENGNFQRWYTSPDDREERQLTLGEFLDMLDSGEQVDRYYMTEHSLRDVSPQLLGDVDLSRYIDDAEPELFLGRETKMPLHYHGVTEALLCQLQGRKRVTLYHPNQYGKLYPGRWYRPAPLFSRVDASSPDLERYPKFGQAEPIEFWLEPGEILYIPVGWWHFTKVEGQAISLSITAVFRAKVRNFHYPSPGLQTLARGALNAVRFRFSKPSA